MWTEHRVVGIEHFEFEQRLMKRNPYLVAVITIKVGRDIRLAHAVVSSEFHDRAFRPLLLLVAGARCAFGKRA